MNRVSTSRFGWLGVPIGAMLLCGGAVFAAATWESTVPAPAPVRAPALAAVPGSVLAPSAAVAASVAATPRAVPAAAPTLAQEPFVVKQVLRIDGPFRHGDYVWEAKGAPGGPLVITVDLAAQTLSVFRGGHEIGAAVIMYGADNKPTPLGVFPITQKDADHVSNLYDAPMPYMLRLTADGVSIHGSQVKRDFATNGCIGVPTEFAKLLFREARLGDRVIITNGERLEVGEAITAI